MEQLSLNQCWWCPRLWLGRGWKSKEAVKACWSSYSRLILGNGEIDFSFLMISSVNGYLKILEVLKENTIRFEFLGQMKAVDKVLNTICILLCQTRGMCVCSTKELKLYLEMNAAPLQCSSCYIIFFLDIHLLQQNVDVSFERIKVSASCCLSIIQ